MKNTDKIVAETKYLRMVDRGGWVFAQRVIGDGAVCVVATTENNRDIILVEQFRKPVGKRVIELPAGLIGDSSEEEPMVAGRRELIEETGYDSNQWEHLYTAPSSSGLSDEMIHMVRARNVSKIGTGGGVDGEDIQVHVVPVRSLFLWLLDNKTAYVDHKIYAALAWIAEL